MIPKVANIFWLGKMNPEVEKNINDMKRGFVDNGWKFNIINPEENKELIETKFYIKFLSNNTYTFLSDISRVMTIYKDGGFYLDANTKVNYKNITELYEKYKNKNGVFFNGEPNTVASSFFMAQKGNKILKTINDTLVTWDNGFNPHYYTAPLYFTQSLMQNGWKYSFEIIEVEGNIILPLEFSFNLKEKTYLQWSGQATWKSNHDTNINHKRSKEAFIKRKVTLKYWVVSKLMERGIFAKVMQLPLMITPFRSYALNIKKGSNEMKKAFNNIK